MNAARKNARLARRAVRPRADDATAIDRFREAGQQPLPLRVEADDAGKRGAGAKRGDVRQETDTISRLVYGFATAYMMTGDERYLEGAEKGTEYLRDHMRYYDTDEDVVYFGDTGGGFENLTGSAGSDTLFMIGSGTHRIDGGDGDDTVFGESGQDILSGGAGDDTLLGEDGDDRLSGGDGSDTLDYSGWTTSVTVNLSVPYAVDTEGTATGTTGVSNIRHVIGGQEADQITGNLQANWLRGGPGDDTLHGLSGDDTLEGGLGEDVLDGGYGSDTTTRVLLIVDPKTSQLLAQQTELVRAVDHEIGQP